MHSGHIGDWSSDVCSSDLLDFKTATAGPDAIVIEQFGAIKLYDLATRQARNVNIHVAGDVEAVRPHFAKVDPKRIQNFSIPLLERGLSSKPGEKSSPFPLTKATFATSRALPPWPTAIPPGLPMASP
jgi:hypothetical protein